MLGLLIHELPMVITMGSNFFMTLNYYLFKWIVAYMSFCLFAGVDYEWLHLWFQCSNIVHTAILAIVYEYPSNFKQVVTTFHHNDVIMGAMASQITSLIIAYPIVYSGADQRKHQSSASLAFVWVIHRWPVNSPHKWPVKRKMIPLDDVIMDKDDRVPKGWYQQ